MSQTVAEKEKEAITPFEPGRYWYSTLGLPDGVRALLVRTITAAGGRFTCTTKVQAQQLAQHLHALAYEIGNGVGSADEEPPEVAG